MDGQLDEADAARAAALAALQQECERYRTVERARVAAILRGLRDQGLAVAETLAARRRSVDIKRGILQVRTTFATVVERGRAAAAGARGGRDRVPRPAGDARSAKARALRVGRTPRRRGASGDARLYVLRRREASGRRGRRRGFRARLGGGRASRVTERHRARGAMVRGRGLRLDVQRVVARAFTRGPLAPTSGARITTRGWS